MELLQFEEMNDNMNQQPHDDILKFDLPLYKSSYIKVIGVGGGGGNAVNHMYRQGIEGVDFIVCNTDAQALDSSPVPTKIQLGKGLGAGNIPDVAQNAARAKADEIKSVLGNNTRMLFITAGMGGGTGTGAAPVIAQIAKEITLDDDEVKKILTVGIVTTPFNFEGPRRMKQAQQGIEELRKHVDAILVINNDKLRAFGDLGMTKAFAKADDILTTAARGISEIITVSSYVQIDFRDVNTVMKDSGVALMGHGLAEGENRAENATIQAINSPLLNDNDIHGAKDILLYISYGEQEPSMDEIEAITGIITKQSGGNADLIWGAGKNSKLGNNISVTLIATGFKTSEIFHIPTKRKQQEIVDLEEESCAVTVNAINPESPVIDIDGAIHEPTETHETISENIQPEPVEKTPLSFFDDFLSQSAQENNKNTIEIKETEIEEDEMFVVKNNNETTQEMPPVGGGYVAYTRDRLRQLSISMNNVNEKIRNEQGLEEIEKVPAYKRRQMELVETIHSSEIEISKTSITSDGRIITTNSYLHDNVD